MRLEIESVVAPTAFSHEPVDVVSNTPQTSVGQMLKNAIAAAQNGDRNNARVLLFKVSGAEPSNIDAWLWLASVSEYPEELLGFLVKALEIDPQNERAKSWERATRSLLAKTFVQRGVQAVENGQRDVAAQCFDEALEYDLSCASAWLNKSGISDSVEEKELCLARVLDIDPNNREAHQELQEISTNRSAAKMDAARVAAFAGDFLAARETVDSMLVSDPENVAAWKLHSQLAASLPEKLEIYQRVLNLDPNDAFARAGYDYLSAEKALADKAAAEPAYVEPAESVETWTPEPVEAVQQVHNDPFESLAATEPEPEPLDLYEINAELNAYEPEPVNSFEDHFESEDLYVEETVAEQPESYEDNVPSEFSAPETNAVPEPAAHTTRCAFCGGDNDAQAFSCGCCNAVLSISDIDTVFGNAIVDAETVQDAVTRMEAEWNLREFSESELTTLGLGHFNLHNYEKGLLYLQEASSLNPNNVILAGQINAFAIRLDEMRRQEENREALPKGKTILVVDDSATVRRLISSKLEKCGHNVLSAVDGVEAMEIIENVVPDLVLLDIAMPRMDGYSVCKLIRANDTVKDVPVVMISGKDGFFDKVRGRMAGTTGYITKPFGPETLMRALETYLVPDAAVEGGQFESEIEEAQFDRYE